MQKIKYRFSPDPFGVHQKIISQVMPGSRVLEIGCASGYMTKFLKNLGCEVYGIEIDRNSAHIAEKYAKKVIVGDIEDAGALKKVQDEKFDVIIFADVLEHLKNPYKVLFESKKYLKRGGSVLISVPNVAFLTTRLNLLLGRFDYSRVGIMDETHIRFFTQKSIRQMVKNAGLSITKIYSIGNFTQLPLFMQTIYPAFGQRSWWRAIEQKITSLWPEGLSVQFLLVCEKG